MSHLQVKKAYRIGIDLMGNDHSPSVLLDALRSIPPDPGIELIPIGTADSKSASPFPFQEASEFVRMDESPVVALKKKKDGSMFLGLHLLKKGEFDAFVTAGNSGALVLGSKIILSTFKGISRPAFLSYVPTKKKPVAVMDLGANVQCKATHLVQFAYMTAAYLRASAEIQKPRLGLLNIGEEPLKGPSELRRAYYLLKNLSDPPFEFTGNVEGKSVFDGEVDALITDGFTGNVFLKTAEGLASFILDQISAKNPKLADLQKRLHYTEYPGAILLGVKGLVVKCHGYSTPKAFINAVQGTIERVKKDFMKSFINLLRS